MRSKKVYALVKKVLYPSLNEYWIWNFDYKKEVSFQRGFNTFYQNQYLTDCSCESSSYQNVDQVDTEEVIIAKYDEYLNAVNDEVEIEANNYTEIEAIEVAKINLTDECSPRIQTNSTVEVDEDDLSLQLKQIIKQSQKNRDLWEKSCSLPSWGDLLTW